MDNMWINCGVDKLWIGELNGVEWSKDRFGRGFGGVDFVEKWTMVVLALGQGADVRTCPRYSDIERWSNCFDFVDTCIQWYPGFATLLYYPLPTYGVVFNTPGY